MRISWSYTKFFVAASTTVLMLVPCSSKADVTGRVMDNTGKPVANATITYVNLANRLTWTYAGADGRFTLPDPTKAAWNAPDSAAVVMSRPATFSAAPHRLDPAVANNRLFFNVPAGKSVDLRLYSLSGRLVEQRRLDGLENGRYGLDLASFQKGRAAANLFLLKINAPGESCVLKVPAFTHSAPSSQSGHGHEASITQVRSYAKAGIDQVRAGRTYHFPVIKDIDSYTQNVGDITITGFDCEARLDSVIAAASDSPHVYLNQCIMHNEWDNPQASVDKSAGAHFMAGHVKPNVTGDPRLASAYATYMNSYRSAHQNSRHKIPLLVGYDAVHGVNMCDNTTIFPHNVGLGAMRDLELAQVAYRVTAIEMAGTGCPWTFAPCIAVARNIGWGRTYESYGETPELVSKMAKVATLGLQTFDLSHPLAVAACAKHFAADGGTIKGTSSQSGAIYDRGDAQAADNVLRTIHLAPYTAALEAEVASVMASFSKWNGTFMHVNKTLMTDWLRTQKGFKGWICGDYDGHTQVAGGEESCMMAGLDMAMHAGTPPQKLNNQYQTMYAAGGDKKTRVMDAARRILRMKMAMGLFDRSPLADAAVTAVAGSQLHRDVARACVRESMVLLKNNNNVLPLAKTGKVHLIGSHADNMGYQCGGWTLGWAEQNLANDAFKGATTIKQGFEKLAPGKVTYTKDAATVPADAVAVVVFFGEKVHAEWFGDSQDLGPTDWNVIPGDANPVQLISGARKAGKPVIGVMISSRPMIVSSYIDSLDAFVCAWLPGTEGGGIAEVLYGDYDFKGTLPHSWPSAFIQEPLNVSSTEYGGDKGDLKGATGTWQWQYGYGLSYKGGTLKAPF